MFVCVCVCVLCVCLCEVSPVLSCSDLRVCVYNELSASGTERNGTERRRIVEADSNSRELMMHAYIHIYIYIYIYLSIAVLVNRLS